MVVQMNRPRCIVLDLDETLVHTFSSRYNKVLKRLKVDQPNLQNRLHKLEIETGQRGEGQFSTVWTIVRPGTFEFLRECFLLFDFVVVWSAGSWSYVHEIVQILFDDTPMPFLVLSRDDCVVDDYLHKPLRVLATRTGGVINQHNSVLLDDRIENFKENPKSGILAKPYQPGLDQLHYKDTFLNEVLRRV